MVIPQTVEQEIDLIYYRAFPVHKFLKHTDCTVKDKAGSLKHKDHYLVLHL